MPVDASNAGQRNGHKRIKQAIRQTMSQQI